MNRGKIYYVLRSMHMANKLLGWQLALLSGLMILRLKLTQILTKSVEKIENGKYILHHNIDNQPVDIIIKRVPKEKQPYAVFNSQNVNIIHGIRSYLRFAPVPFSNDIIFEDDLVYKYLDNTSTTTLK